MYVCMYVCMYKVNTPFIRIISTVCVTDLIFEVLGFNDSSPIILLLGLVYIEKGSTVRSQDSDLVEFAYVSTHIHTFLTKKNAHLRHEQVVIIRGGLQ